jgi:hypothetical protein
VVAREQFVLVAARPGESAANLNRERTGLFTRELMRELQATNPGQWPPDMDAVCQRLVNRFSELRAQGQADQTPAYLWNRDWHSNQQRTIGQFPDSSRAKAGRSHTLQDLPLQDRAILRDALLACPSFKRYDTREDLRLQLRPAIAFSVHHALDDRSGTLNILDTSMRFPGGLAELLEVLAFADGADPAVKQFEEKVRQIVPGTLPATP